ncbi:MAG: hypothetical protein KF708_03235 [Pirellulales bacterium]|nr:hypothetical protein [Pirellulales bacterium]
MDCLRGGVTVLFDDSASCKKSPARQRCKRNDAQLRVSAPANANFGEAAQQKNRTKRGLRHKPKCRSELKKEKVRPDSAQNAPESPSRTYGDERMVKLCHHAFVLRVRVSAVGGARQFGSSRSPSHKKPIPPKFLLRFAYPGGITNIAPVPCAGHRKAFRFVQEPVHAVF